MEAVAANRDTSIRHSGSPFDPAVPMAEGKGQFCLYRLHCLQSRHHRESLARIPEGREQLLWIHFGACVRHDDDLCPDVRFLCGAWIAWPRQNHCCHVGWAIGFSLSLFFFLIVFINVTTYFMPFVMYRQRCSAVDAFREVLR